MSREQELRESLKRLYRKPVINFVATVKSVQGKTCTVSPIDGGVDISGVRLSPVINADENGLLISPTVGSTVVVSKLKVNTLDTRYFVAMFSQISSVRMITSDGEFSLVKAEPLIEELDKTNAVVIAMMEAFSEWIVTPNDGGAALKTKMALKLTGIDVGDYSNIKNENVKHA